MKRPWSNANSGNGWQNCFFCSFLLPSPGSGFHLLLEIHKAGSLKQNSWRYFTRRQGIKCSARKEPRDAFLANIPNKEGCVNGLFSSNTRLDELMPPPLPSRRKQASVCVGLSSCLVYWMLGCAGSNFGVRRVNKRREAQRSPKKLHLEMRPQMERKYGWGMDRKPEAMLFRVHKKGLHFYFKNC